MLLFLLLAQEIGPLGFPSLFETNIKFSRKSVNSLTLIEFGKTYHKMVIPDEKYIFPNTKREMSNLI